VNACVVDASVAVKWFLPEIHWEAAWRLRDSQIALQVPAFFELEFGNVLCKKVRRGELSR
jgi:predicted nucleic acid-binding protein